MPPTTNVCKRGNSTNFKALLSVVSTDFPELFHAKKKTVKRSVNKSNTITFVLYILASEPGVDFDH